MDFTIGPVKDEGRVVCLVAEGREFAQEANRQHEIENLFRQFASTMPAMLWLTGPDAGCTFFSRGWSEYTGQSEEQALGFGWLDAVHADDRDETRRAVVAAHGKGEPFTLHCRVRRADGTYRWVLYAGRARFAPGGRFAGYNGSVIDIDERMKASETSALLGAIVESCDDAIISKNLNGIIMSWNPAAERLFGYTAGEAVGQSITILIPPDRQDEEIQILQQLRQGNRVDHFETIRMCKDGRRLNISLTISPVKDAD